MQVTKFADDPKTPFKSVGTCQHCKRDVVFMPVSKDKAFGGHPNKQKVPEYTFIGLRQCPACHHVTTIIARGTTPENAVIKEYWGRGRFEVNWIPVPERIAGALNDAVRCQTQGMYTLAATAIRSSIDLMCDDMGATGKDLIDRIRNLKDRMVLPNDIIDGMHTLRIFGNEGAHIYTKVFDVTEQECSIALDLATEIARSLYAHRSLINRMNELKK